MSAAVSIKYVSVTIASGNPRHMTIDKYLLSMVIKPMLDQEKEIAETAPKCRAARLNARKAAGLLFIWASRPSEFRCERNA